jgi:hypothetical protein
MNCGTSLAACGGVLRRVDAERVASSFALIAFAAVAKLLLLCDWAAVSMSPLLWETTVFVVEK